jgi:hypothetical protein
MDDLTWSEVIGIAILAGLMIGLALTLDGRGLL